MEKKSMKKNLVRRMRRAKKIRMKLRTYEVPRLSVHMSQQHIYAQVFDAQNGNVLASASTLDKEVKSLLEKQALNVKSAEIVGKVVANRAVAAGVSKVGFDRSGFKYHGRVRALADAARQNGLVF
jgi:large subunit ribosomal protein L18